MWYYIGNRSILYISAFILAVIWGDTDIPVVVNEPSWLPDPHDNSGPSQPVEEGRVIDNHTVGAQGIPLCLANGTQCLNITSQVWLTIVSTTRD